MSTRARADELRRLIGAEITKAISVPHNTPIKSINPTDKYHILTTELETIENACEHAYIRHEQGTICTVCGMIEYDTHDY